MPTTRARAILLTMAGTAAGFSGIAGTAAAQDGGITLAPHRAVYEMELESAEASSGVTSVSGRLVFEVLGSACEGYTVNMRFVSQIDSEESSTTSDLQSATFEEGDGSAYRFVSRSFFNESLSETTDGMATRGESGIVVDLDQPEDTEFTLEGDVLFPTQHVRHVLEAAAAGETIVAADVYDGSDSGRKVYATTSVIGNPHPLGEHAGPGEEVLAEIESWPITIAYFDTSEGDGETPSYEFTYDIYANGVSSRVVLNYGGFTIGGGLSSIEFVEPEPCEG